MCWKEAIVGRGIWRDCSLGLISIHGTQRDWLSYLVLRYGNSMAVIAPELGEIEEQQGNAGSSPHNGVRVLYPLVLVLSTTCEQSGQTFKTPTHLLGT